MKRYCTSILIFSALFFSCGRNKENSIVDQTLDPIDSSISNSSYDSSIIYDSDSIPVFYMGQNVYGAEVEAPPTFQGKQYQEFGNYVNKKIEQSAIKAQPKSRGLVMVKFIVDYTGDVSFARAVLADGPEIEAEAIRIIKSSPKWEPAKMNGQDANLVVTWTLRFPKE